MRDILVQVPYKYAQRKYMSTPRFELASSSKYLSIVPYCATRAKFLKRRVHTDKNSRAQEAYEISKKQKNSLTTRYVANRMQENDSVACDATRQMHFLSHIDRALRAHSFTDLQTDGHT